MTTTRSPASGSSILAWKGCRFVCTTGGCLSEEGQEIPVSGERPCSEEIDLRPGQRPKGVAAV